MNRRMTKSQTKAIDSSMTDLLARADTGALLMFFHARGAIEYSKYDELKESRFSSKRAQATEFFNTIKGLNDAWTLLEQGLDEANQSWLWTQLFEAEKAARVEPQQNQGDKAVEVWDIVFLCK